VPDAGVYEFHAKRYGAPIASPSPPQIPGTWLIPLTTPTRRAQTQRLIVQQSGAELFAWAARVPE